MSRMSLLLGADEEYIKSVHDLLGSLTSEAKDADREESRAWEKANELLTYTDPPKAFEGVLKVLEALDQYPQAGWGWDPETDRPDGLPLYVSLECAPHRNKKGPGLQKTLLIRLVLGDVSPQVAEAMLRVKACQDRKTTLLEKTSSLIRVLAKLEQSS